MGEEFDDSSLEEMDYSDAEDSSFEGTDFEEGTFEESDFGEGDFEEGAFEEEGFEEFDFEEETFEEEDFEESDFEEGAFEEGDFEEGTFEEEGFEESDFEEGDFEETDFQETNVEEQELEESDFQETDTEEADVEEPELEESDFEEEDLEEQDFEEGNSQETDTEEADIEESELEESDFQEADFAESDSGENDDIGSESGDEWGDWTEDSPEEEDSAEAEDESGDEAYGEAEESVEEPAEEMGEASGAELPEAEENFEEVQELLDELEAPEEESEEREISSEVQELLDELDEAGEVQQAADVEGESFDDRIPEMDADKAERLEAALYDLDEGYNNAFQMNANLMEDISKDQTLTQEQKEQLLAELERDNERLAEEKKAYTQKLISGKMDGDESDGDAKVLRLRYEDPGKQRHVYERRMDAGAIGEYVAPTEVSPEGTDVSDTGGDQRDLGSIRDKFAAFLKKGTDDSALGRDFQSEAMDRAKEHAQEMIDDYCETELKDFLSGEKKELRLQDTAVFQNDKDFARGYGDEQGAREINGYNDGEMSYIKESGPHPIKTAIHEHNHQLSSNDLKDDFGHVLEYRRGISINGQDTQVNEALTEFFTRKIMDSDYPENPCVGYRDNMERMETMAEAFGLDTMKEAYYQNKPGLLRGKFEEVMGSGAWEALSNAFDNSLKDYDDEDIAIKWAHYRKYGDYNVDTPTDAIRRAAVSEANKLALLFALGAGGGN